MSYQFGSGSARKLVDLDEGMALVARCALRYGIMDFSVVETLRVKAIQDRYYRVRKSKVRWPDSKHNVPPGKRCSRVKAMDLVPWVNGAPSYDWRHCLVLAGIVLAAGAQLHVPIRWGGCWSGDPGDIGHQGFNDLVHFERKG